MKMRFWLSGVMCGAVLTLRAATNDISAALQKGLFEEEANHNYDAAIAAYQSVSAQFDKDRKLAATAIFRLGEIYRKQGKTNEALAQYERIVREFTDQEALLRLSRQNLTESKPLRLSSSENDFTEKLNEIITRAAAGVDMNSEFGQRLRKIILRATTGDLDILDKTLAKAEYARDEALLSQLKSLSRDELIRVIPTVAPDQQLNALTAELNLAEQRIIALHKDYKGDHPVVQNAEAQIKQLERKVNDRVDGILVGLEMRLKSLKASLEAIEK